jgi:hypothetical protein
MDGELGDSVAGDELNAAARSLAYYVGDRGAPIGHALA